MSNISICLFPRPTKTEVKQNLYWKTKWLICSGRFLPGGHHVNLNWPDILCTYTYRLIDLPIWVSLHFSFSSSFARAHRCSAFPARSCWTTTTTEKLWHRHQVVVVAAAHPLLLRLSSLQILPLLLEESERRPPSWVSHWKGPTRHTLRRHMTIAPHHQSQ